MSNQSDSDKSGDLEAIAKELASGCPMCNGSGDGVYVGKDWSGPTGKPCEWCDGTGRDRHHWARISAALCAAEKRGRLQTQQNSDLAARIDELEQQLDHAESELPLAIKLWRNDNKTRTRVKRILINKDGMSVGATAALVLDYIESAPARVISAIVSAECKVTSGSSRTCRRGTRGCTIRHKLDKS